MYASRRGQDNRLLYKSATDTLHLVMFVTCVRVATFIPHMCATNAEHFATRTIHVATSIIHFAMVSLDQILNVMGWGSLIHGGFPRNLELSDS